MRFVVKALAVAVASRTLAVPQSALALAFVTVARGSHLRGATSDSTVNNYRQLDFNATTRIDGGLATVTSGRFSFYLGGGSSYSRIKVTGDASFGGGVNDRFTFYLLGNYGPAVGEALTGLTAGGALTGLDGFSNWAIYSFSANGQPVLWASAADGVVDPTAPAGLAVTFAGGALTFNAAVVPEPSQWLLWLAGFGGMAFVVRRRQALGR